MAESADKRGFPLFKGMPKVAAKPKANEATGVSDPGQLDPDTLKKVKDATVLIGNFENGRLNSTGSGFVVDDGRTVLTAKHVVTGDDDQPDPCKIVFFSGSPNSKIVTTNAQAVSHLEDVRRTDPRFDGLDVAAIRLQDKVAEPLTIGSTVGLLESTGAWAFGYPHGDSNRSLDKDLPSCTVHSLRVERVERKGDKTKILQLSGSPTYGDSGGPIVLRDATVIGVVQAKDKTTSSIFAVPEAPMLAVLSKSKKRTVTAADFTSPLEGFADPAPTTTRPRSSGGGGPKIVGRSVLADFRVTEYHLEDMSARTLTLLRNEPFARRGYRFKRPELRRVFEATDWYVARTSDTEAIRRTFNSNERYNVDFIKRYQNANGMNW